MDSSHDNLASVSSSAIDLCGKSWTAYVGITIRLLVLLGLGFAAVYWQPTYWKVTALVLLFGLILIIYRVLLLRSYRLYYDDTGVWIFSGVLPWKRGVAGVKWRDLDEAIFVNSFWSWMSRSYTVQLRHRFTKAIEISETNMANGKQAVLTINQQLQQHISQETAPRASPSPNRLTALT